MRNKIAKRLRKEVNQQTKGLPEREYKEQVQLNPKSMRFNKTGAQELTQNCTRKVFRMAKERWRKKNVLDK